jgi:lipopolysaccharide export system protein LptC
MIQKLERAGNRTGTMHSTSIEHQNTGAVTNFMFPKINLFESPEQQPSFQRTAECQQSIQGTQFAWQPKI